MMDFPSFYMDHLAGGRLIIGLIASLHVLINHPLAVGAYPLLTWMEWWAHKNKRPEVDQLAYKIAFVVFIVTTTVGAMTGVGIWLSTSLFAPFAIGSLLRVFFWGWFLEWGVFIAEVVLIMGWFLSWKKADTPEKKRKHIKIGVVLSIMSWITMALIVAVLGFMMKPGDWNQTRAFWDAMTNPLYAPQLGFRTCFAFMTGAVFLWFATFFFTKSKPRLRHWVVYRLSHVVLIALLGTFLFGVWYWSAIPETMKANSSVALLTQEFMGWHGQFQRLLGWTMLAFLVVGIGGLGTSFMVPRWALLIPSFMGIWLLGHFERAREFMRKPWVIGEYMYSNGVHKEELSFLQCEGLLKHATYVKHREITEVNKVECGKDVFMLACSRCHSTTGLNSVLDKFTAMYGGDKPWDAAGMRLFIKGMHQTRTYMPPFPGNDKEAEALVAYILQLREKPETLHGAQTEGIVIAPVPSGPAMTAQTNSTH
jgi:mono/diheme cytochrome c family protein